MIAVLRNILFTAENRVLTERDLIGHAETNLVRLASRIMEPSQLIKATMYTSTEPCAMCFGAVQWSGARRAAYALAATELNVLAGADPNEPLWGSAHPGRQRSFLTSSTAPGSCPTTFTHLVDQSSGPGRSWAAGPGREADGGAAGHAQEAEEGTHCR